MRKYSEKLIAFIFGLVLLFELGTLAYYWFRAKPFNGKADVVIKHSSTQEKISIDTQKATRFIKSIPSAMRADLVKVNIYDIIPDENNITLAFFLPVTMTTAGLSDTGALCTEPKLSSDDRSSEIDFYATPNKLAAQIGIKKAHSEINNLFLECLGYAAMRREHNLSSYISAAKQAFSDTDSLPTVLSVSL